MRRTKASLAWAARRVARLVVVLAGLWVSVAVVGEWVTAAGVAAVILVRGLGQWVVFEQCLDERAGRTASASVSGSRGDGASGLVAFARALVAVSAHYLDMCEDQADEHTRSGERWR